SAQDEASIHHSIRRFPVVDGPHRKRVGPAGLTEQIEILQSAGVEADAEEGRARQRPTANDFRRRREHRRRALQLTDRTHACARGLADVRLHLRDALAVQADGELVLRPEDAWLLEVEGEEVVDTIAGTDAGDPQQPLLPQRVANAAIESEVRRATYPHPRE